MNKTINKAVAYYRKENQINKAIEEMAELTIELARIGTDRFDKHKVAEEIADVKIMMKQLELIFSCRFETTQLEIRKLERLEERMGE